MKSMLLASDRSILIFCGIVRFCSFLLVGTYFVPDEFYQAVEPAHRLVFGNGFVSWEYETANALRSYIYSTFLAIPYYVIWTLERIMLTSLSNIATYLPALFHTVIIGFVTDYAYLKLAQMILSPRGTILAVFLHLTQWFIFYCMPRTLTNTVEMCLLLMGLKAFPWPSAYLTADMNRILKSSSIICFSFIAALATVIRPTSALFWTPLCIWYIFRQRHVFATSLFNIFAPAFIIVLLSAIIDRIGYGRWTLSWFNFAMFNVVQGGSAHFGIHPMLWYLSSGLPSVLGPHMVPLALALVQLKPNHMNRICLYLCLFYLFFHSVFIAHKEQRFLLPLLPLFNIYIAEYLSVGLPDKPVTTVKDFLKTMKFKVKFLMGMLLVFSVPVIIYTCVFHQRAPITIMSSIRARITEERNGVLFLMPCHTTPFYSHVHVNVPMKMLRCDPPLNNSASNYIDEADLFHENPNKFLAERVFIGANNYSLIVLFESMFDRLRDQLESEGYRFCDKRFHSHFPISDRQSKYMILLCR